MRTPKQHTLQRTRAVNMRTTDYDTFIGRAGNGEDGYFGNPFKDGTRQENLGRYEEYFLDRILSDTEFARRVEALRGGALGCFCHQTGEDTWSYRQRLESRPHSILLPYYCHGDVIACYLEYGWLDGLWWMSTQKMTFDVHVRAGRVVHGAPIIKKFLDAPAKNLVAWLRKQGSLTCCRLQNPLWHLEETRNHLDGMLEAVKRGVPEPSHRGACNPQAGTPCDGGCQEAAYFAARVRDVEDFLRESRRMVPRQ